LQGDFGFNFVAALNGAPDAVSLQSSNYPTYYVAPIADPSLQATRLGITPTYNNDDASFALQAGLSNSSAFSLQSLSKTFPMLVRAHLLSFVPRTKFRLADGNSRCRSVHDRHQNAFWRAAKASMDLLLVMSSWRLALTTLLPPPG
jgi:hypothetical protein